MIYNQVLLQVMVTVLLTLYSKCDSSLEEEEYFMSLPECIIIGIYRKCTSKCMRWPTLHFILAVGSNLHVCTKGAPIHYVMLTVHYNANLACSSNVCSVIDDILYINYYRLSISVCEESEYEDTDSDTDSDYEPDIEICEGYLVIRSSYSYIDLR